VGLSGRDDLSVDVTEMSSQGLRLGIAGCGRIVERGYLPALADSTLWTLAALADPELRRAQWLGEAYGAAAYASSEEMLTAGGLDGIVVATPADLHEQTASAAAAVGIPSLVEKPPAADLSGATALAALDPQPAIGFNRRFLQGAALLPSIPREGWLDLRLELRFRRTGWDAHTSRDEALLDAGIHLIDLAAFLTGSDPIAVRTGRLEHERAEIELELGRGRARISCATDRPYAERVEVRDRAGRILAASRSDRWRAALGRLLGGEEPLTASLRRQLQSFAARARGEDAASLAGPRDGIAAMAVVEAAVRSARLGGAEVTVPDPVGAP
jgi:myo-inositol 2-dehydrogenase / D-chiro-inositol 1-dehydrogenase